MVSKTFLTAGKAIFTVTNTKRNTRLTFRIEKPEPDRFRGEYFAAVMKGTDNESDYRYMGMVSGERLTLRETKGSLFRAGTPEFDGLKFVLDVIAGRITAPPALQVQTAGLCGRCGLKLTVPESISTEFGPDCAEKLGIPYAKVTTKPVRKAKAPKAAAPAGLVRVTEDPDMPPGLTQVWERVPCRNQLGPVATPQELTDTIASMTGEEFVTGLDAKFDEPKRPVSLMDLARQLEGGRDDYAPVQIGLQYQHMDGAPEPGDRADLLRLPRLDPAQRAELLARPGHRRRRAQGGHAHGDFSADGRTPAEGHAGECDDGSHLRPLRHAGLGARREVRRHPAAGAEGRARRDGMELPAQRRVAHGVADSARDDRRVAPPP
jgi:hypothetical protein